MGIPSSSSNRRVGKHVVRDGKTEVKNGTYLAEGAAGSRWLRGSRRPALAARWRSDRPKSTGNAANGDRLPAHSADTMSEPSIFEHRRRRHCATTRISRSPKRSASASLTSFSKRLAVTCRIRMRRTLSSAAVGRAVSQNRDEHPVSIPADRPLEGGATPADRAPAC
jgi:hypothetical protein